MNHYKAICVVIVDGKIMFYYQPEELFRNEAEAKQMYGKEFVKLDRSHGIFLPVLPNIQSGTTIQ